MIKTFSAKAQRKEPEFDSLIFIGHSQLKNCSSLNILCGLHKKTPLLFQVTAFLFIRRKFKY